MLDQLLNHDLIQQVTDDPLATSREHVLVDRLSMALQEIDDLVVALHNLHAEMALRGWDGHDGIDP